MGAGTRASTALREYVITTPLFPACSGERPVDHRATALEQLLAFRRGYYKLVDLPQPEGPTTTKNPPWTCSISVSVSSRTAGGVVGLRSWNGVFLGDCSFFEGGVIV